MEWLVTSESELDDSGEEDSMIVPFICHLLNKGMHLEIHFNRIVLSDSRGAGIFKLNQKA